MKYTLMTAVFALYSIVYLLICVY